MNKSHSFYKTPWRMVDNDQKDKWDHRGFDEMIKEETNKKEDFQNSNFKRKKNDNYYHSFKEKNSFKTNYIKNENQMVKCYTKKVNGLSNAEERFKIENFEKNEKNDEKELAYVEDKLSNVSTTYSSREKNLEDDLNTPIACPMRNSNSLARFDSTPTIFQINLLLPNETLSIEIFNEEQLEEKLNEIKLSHLQNTNTSGVLAIQIFVLENLRKIHYFPENFIEKLINKYLMAYEKCRVIELQKNSHAENKEV